MSEHSPAQLLDSVLDQMLEGLQILSPDWTYLYVNETVAQQAHTTKEELTGKKFTELYPEALKTELFATMERVMQTRSSERMENEFSFPDGSSGWFQLFIHPCDEGILILSLDISEQVKLREKLDDSLQKLDTLMDAAITREKRMIELKEVIRQIWEQLRNFGQETV
ncbi:MAG: PAS fold protein [candidate division WS6 bacterium OLB20]|uniref:PAS fold protein n=1 Tax=candidate division WS6 bacterium OLB20 TaxID=1617426 RepID=A0A136LWJ9_9BACT|nr:MAG: PAS fold protein [candidate division WS6 bacterium OLB20]